MDFTTIVVPSSSASSVDSNQGPIQLSSDADSGGGDTNTKKRTASSVVVSNHGPVALPSDDDDDDDTILDETTRKKPVAAERKRLRMEPIYTCTYWEYGDERTMLMELAAGLRETGQRPTLSELVRTLKAKATFNRPNITSKVIGSKICNLKMKFIKALDKGGPGNRSYDKKIYELSKEVWPEELLKRRRS